MVNIIRRVDYHFCKFEFVFVVICGIGIIGLTLLVVLDVTLRYFFSSPIPGGVEATELILPYIVFLGLAYTLRVNGHVRVNILFDRLPSRLKVGADTIDSIVGILFFGLLTIYGWLHFWESVIILEFMMAPIKLPWYVGKFSMPLGTFAITIRFLFKLLRMTLGYSIESEHMEAVHT